MDKPEINELTFKKLFNLHYRELCFHAVRFVRHEAFAEEIVQEVFIRLWEKREEIHISQSIKAYLYKAVRNRCINELKKAFQKIHSLDDSGTGPEFISDHEGPHEIMTTAELERVLNDSLKLLPERCYAVFALSRFSGMTNREIAEELNISVKTVENQITIALRKIRAHLENEWSVALPLLLPELMKIFNSL